MQKVLNSGEVREGSLEEVLSKANLCRECCAFKQTDCSWRTKGQASEPGMWGPP